VRKDEAWEKIEMADRQLFALRNELSLGEYERDLGDKAAADRIERINIRIGSLLSEPLLAEAVSLCQASTSRNGTADRRKADLLKKEITFWPIENHSALRRHNRAIQRTFESLDLPRTWSLLGCADRKKRRTALAKIGEANATVEPNCRELLKMYNKAAQEAGYTHYAEAKLAYEGLTEAELYNFFRGWRDRLMPRWKRCWRRTSEELGGDIDVYDLVHVYRRLPRQAEDKWEAVDKMRALRELVIALGGSLDDLPIRFELRDVPFSGACYRVMPGRDVRVVLNSRHRGSHAYFFLLHEFGHAMYYCFCPFGSELMIDCHLAREIMADLWTRFLNEKSFLTQVMGFPAHLAQDTIQARSEYESLRLLLYIRDSVFSLEAMHTPDVPFAEIWRSASNEWLGVDEQSSAFETFDFLHPLDMKSYVFAQVLADETFTRLHSGPFELLETPGALDKIIDWLYRPGRMIEWRTKFRL